MLSQIEVRDFRCFENARLDFHPRATVLLGRNAQGKTSLLEAICVLLRLQSPRTSERTDLIRHGCSSFLIQGQWHGQTLRYGMSAKARRLAVDGAVLGKTSEYLQQSGLVVWMDYADMNLLRGTAEHRRRFLDFAASQLFPGYLHALQGYNRALRSRNYTLKKEALVNWRQADAYALLMEGFQTTLATGRGQLIAWLQPHAESMVQGLSKGSERVGLDYRPGCELGRLVETLRENRAEEERSRTTFAGAHRDDFAIHLNGRMAQDFASEGQQRTLALALKLGQALCLEQLNGLPPLLLIDDVFGELDPERRRLFLSSLPRGSQCVITTTHLEWAAALQMDMQTWEVAEAQLKQVG